MYKIRNYKKKDFNLIDSWWKKSGEIGPLAEMLPEESTFILEINDAPSLCLTAYLTNSKEIVYLENFIGNPHMKGDKRTKGSQILLDHVCSTIKDMGYKRVLCISEKESLKKRYKELGMTNTLNNVSTYVKEL